MELRLENIHSFSKALLPLERFHDVADLKCSPKMFSLIISRHFPLIITSLQLLPPYFTNFFCQNQIFQYQIPIKSFYNIMNTMKQRFYSSMILFLHHQQPLNQIFLQFRNPSKSIHTLKDFHYSRICFISCNQVSSLHLNFLRGGWWSRCTFSWISIVTFKRGRCRGNWLWNLFLNWLTCA